jgi:predicted SAM-dependent methyltransferase
MKSGRYLNFDCGGVKHTDWVNIDLVPTSPDVMACDLARGFPFPDDSFDALYSSHVLEHFDPQTGANLMRECRRVLAPRGVCRIVVPDLENQAATYLQKLRVARLDDPVSESEYDWALLELIDQMVRTKSGGMMHDYLIKDHLPANHFLEERIGKSCLAVYRELASGVAPNPGFEQLDFGNN